MDKNLTDTITLAQALEDFNTMLTASGVDWKTCGRTKIRYLNNTMDRIDERASPKIDRITSNKSIGKSVGPNSFIKSTAAGVWTEAEEYLCALVDDSFATMAWLIRWNVQRGFEVKSIS